MKIFGTHDDATVKQLERCVSAELGAIGVLCADGHLGYSMPIGGVIGYRKHISPSGVGYDIACGNLAAKTNIKAESIAQWEYVRLAEEIQNKIAFGIGRKNNEQVEPHHVFDRIATSSCVHQRELLQLAKDQLGTVGSGNHYVDILEDGDGYLWVAVHFGSRGFGYKTAVGFLNLAQNKEWDARGGEGEMHSPPVLIPTDTPLGQDYIDAMHIAGIYAYAGRSLVVANVLKIIGAQATDYIHNNHNFAWNERHGDEYLWVVRKGATPAFPGQRGFIGGSMGDISVIVKGVDTPAAKEALYSTIHGAGRVMSRTQAAGKQKWVKASWSCKNYRNCDYTSPAAQHKRGGNGELPECPKCQSKLRFNKSYPERAGGGLVNFEEEKAKLRASNIVLRGAGADECPPVYRKLNDVLEAHKGTIEVETVLMPRIVVMAGSDEFDPYKD